MSQPKARPGGPQRTMLHSVSSFSAAPADAPISQTPADIGRQRAQPMHLVGVSFLGHSVDRDWISRGNQDVLKEGLKVAPEN